MKEGGREEGGSWREGWDERREKERERERSRIVIVYQ